MPALSLDILLVGSKSASTERLIFRLAPRGYCVRHVDTLAAAKPVLERFRFGVVLATETLPDGRGYHLANLVARYCGYLFVGVPLSETLWLPVIEGGAAVLGQRALNASVFENEVEMALGAVRAGIGSGDAHNPGAAVSRRVATPKRRGAEAA